MLSCEEVAKLVSQQPERKLSLWQRLNMRLHLLACSACCTYQHQIKALNKLISRRFSCDRKSDVSETQSGTDSWSISEDTCQKIKAALRKQSR